MVKFNETDKRIEVTNEVQAIAPAAEVNTVSDNISQAPEILTVDNIPVYEYEGKKYVYYTDALAALESTNRYSLSLFNVKTEGQQIAYLCDFDELKQNIDNSKPIPYVKIDIRKNGKQQTLFEYNTWINEIVPVVKNGKW